MVGRAVGHLAEEHGHVIRGELGLGLGFPAVGPAQAPGGEDGRAQLREQALVLGVLAAEHLGESRAEAQAHARVVAAGAGEDEGDLALGRERPRGVEDRADLAEGAIGVALKRLGGLRELSQQVVAVLGDDRDG
ncbi:hypothetical protein D3C72_679670 [compost metagenome]